MKKELRWNDSTLKYVVCGMMYKVYNQQVMYRNRNSVDGRE